MFDLWEAEAFELVVSERQFAILVEQTEPLAVVKADPHDDTFLECAVAGRAEYVVNGDKHLLQLGEYRGIQILPPAAFVALLASQST